MPEQNVPGQPEGVIFTQTWEARYPGCFQVLVFKT